MDGTVPSQVIILPNPLFQIESILPNIFLSEKWVGSH